MALAPGQLSDLRPDVWQRRVWLQTGNRQHYLHGSWAAHPVRACDILPVLDRSAIPGLDRRDRDRNRTRSPVGGARPAACRSRGGRAQSRRLAGLPGKVGRKDSRSSRAGRWLVGFDRSGCGWPGAEQLDFTYVCRPLRRPSTILTDVLLLLGGPSGFGKHLEEMKKVLHRPARGLHHGPVALRIAGGRHHSYVALCDLLLWHDRQQLLPNLYNLIRLGPRAYAELSEALLKQFAGLCRQIAPGDTSSISMKKESDNSLETIARPAPSAAPTVATDEEIADRVEGEILRHGGMLECNLLYVYNRQLRRLIGDQKLLSFLRQFPQKFILSSEYGRDFVQTVRMSAMPDALLGQTLQSSSQEGRRAVHDLEAAVVKQLQSWIPKTADHDGPFLPRLARDSRVRRKLQQFVGHCPVAAVAALKRGSLADPAIVGSGLQQDELQGSLCMYGPSANARNSGMSSSEAAWVAELLHLRLFLLDRPELFHVVDSGKECTKNLPSCCCHLKVKLADMAVELLQERAVKVSSETRKPGKAADKATNVDVSSTPTLFSNSEVLIVDMPHNVSTTAILKSYQKLADEEGRARQVQACSSLPAAASGCLLLTWHSSTIQLLQKQEVYEALVYGSLPAEGEIDARLHVVHRRAKTQTFVSPKGTPATTRFRLLSTYRRHLSRESDGSVEEVLSLVECWPLTALENQICTHFAHIGHSIVGDKLQLKRDNAVANGLQNRLYLHCRQVFGNGQFGAFTAESCRPPEFVRLLHALVEEAKEGFATSQLQEEYEEVRSMPQSEVDEMICHYRKRGLSDQDANAVAKILSQYEDFWVHHMMAEELGIQLPRGDAYAMQSGLATGMSFLFFGMVPLLGLAVSTLLRRCVGPEWYRPQFSTAMSLALSATALLTLGAFVSRVVGSRTPIISGLMIMANGFAASIMAFAVSQMLVSAGGKGAWPSQERPRQSDPSATSSPAEAGRYCLDRSGSAGSTPGQSPAESQAWPTFRHQFVHCSSMLWVAVCSAIVAWQATTRAASAYERMHWEVIRVFAYGLLTCLTTGLGAVPFLFVHPGHIGIWGLSVANAVAAGMMLAASSGMLLEAHEHCGFLDWQIFAGLLAGGLFIRASEGLHGDDEEEESEIAALHEALVERKQWRKAMLIFTVMFCHSAAEGIAVGVAFSRRLNTEFGVYISLLLAVHNVPEGLAVALVLVPRGVSATLTALIAILTSVPQPPLALAAFLFVEVFQWLLPLGLAFAAGAMVYVSLHELLVESVEQLGVTKATLASSLSFVTMAGCIYALQFITGI
ncbi:unnamed protein product [Symbiodinium microadriaticum]|nr:unnamed protein product [Symbiodinium microadriaticum]